MWLTFIPLLIWLAIGLCNETPATSPCHDFHSYVCSKSLPERSPKFPDIRSQNLSFEIDQYQEYVFPTREPAKRLWDVVDPDVVSLWLVQFTTYVDGPNWLAHQERHDKTMNLTREEKFPAVELHIKPFPLRILARFYASIKQTCEYLTTLKLPISTHNHFYRGIFEEVRDLHISEIKKYSRYTEDQKKVLVDKVNSLKVIFPFFEYNNVTVWREAKTAYEREYYRLKTLINETKLPESEVEKIIRVAAVGPAMKIFTAYIKEYTSRFVFQHVLATPTKDSFNYHNEVHASVLTFIDPQTAPQDVYHRFLFVLSHELQHVHYNTDTPEFEVEQWENEKQCVVDKINYFGEEWKNSHPQQNLERVYYEDMSNVAGLRLTVVMNALRSSENQELRNVIEKSVSFMCNELNVSRHHNPLDISINTAVSQIPTFNSLYNCTPGDRMYVKTEDLCTTLNIAIENGDFETQKVDEEGLYALSKFMDVLENTADELDAANITTFEGKLFDITVEDVEEEEEALEGSAESSSSESSDSDADEKEENEDDDESLTNALDDSDKEMHKAEIVSAGSKLSMFLFIALFLAFTLQV